MGNKRAVAALALLAATVGLGASASASDPIRLAQPQIRTEHPEFAMVDTPVGEAKATKSKAMPWLSGGTVASAGEGALVVDDDTGMLVMTDRDGNRRAQLRIGGGATQVVYHAPTHTAYVTDRTHDRIVAVKVGSTLSRAGEIKTPAEPFGLALSPSGKTIVVTTVADRTLVGFNTATGKRRWSSKLGPEPRGVAMSPDGREAIVTMLSSATVAKFKFTAGEPPRSSYIPITPRDAVTSTTGKGKAFARNAFAVAYLGKDVAVVPHQISRPIAGEVREVQSTYGGGGGGTPPVEHRLAFLSSGASGPRVASARAQIHQPRALAYNAADDVLFVAGLGSDEVLALENASQDSVRAQWQRQIGDANAPCGITGLAAAPDGDVIAYCTFSHRVIRLAGGDPKDLRGKQEFVVGPQLGRSRLSAAAERGRMIFHRGEDSRVSGRGALACASCHAEGRADGLSWRIQGVTLQTPMLAGRIRGTHPYKWDGKDPTIQDSLRNTVRRLGGTGLTHAQASDLRAYLDALPRPRMPTIRNMASVKRGKQIFFGASGCADCHSGPRTTDRKLYPLAKDLDKVDTPSLIGLANSAPYYHDGSAQTLRAALMDNGTIHDMGVTVHLEDEQVDDLVAYLRTL